MDKRVRVAIVGVGNCASSLVQGVSYYTEQKSGINRWTIGPYHPEDIEFSAAFDVDSTKVGMSLDQAIFLGQNNTIKFADVPTLDVQVMQAPVLDGLGGRYREKVSVSDEPPDINVVNVLRETRTDVVVNYLPVGSEKATYWWANAALASGCAFVNCIPIFVASNLEWQTRFENAGLPIIGDDVKSQFGATIVHRMLTRLLEMRGLTLDRTYQLNFGGNMDFYNMLDSERLTSKRRSKRTAVESEISRGIKPQNIHISPSDYVEWLGDRKWCYIRMEASAFGGVPLNLELKLEVWDSPNSAGVVIDAVRCAKVAMDRGIGGAIVPVCAAYMKSPPTQIADSDAARQLDGWLNHSSDHAVER